MFCTHLAPLLLQSPLWAVRSVFDRRTVTLLRHREALGDTLMLTPLVRGLKQALPDRRVAVATQRRDIFIGNPNVDECRDWHLWRTGRTVRAHYGSEDMEHLEHVVMVQWRNLWKELRAARVTDLATPPKLPGLQPELFLSEEEKAQGRDDLRSGVPLALRDRPVVLVSSGGKRRPVHNREWGVNNYQAVVEALAPHVALIQIGGEEALYIGNRRLVNMGNRPVRETAALFAAADALILQEGGLHHLARAVEAPSVVIFGGSVLPKQTGYDKQLNLSNRTDCSPCLALRKNCLHMKCMATITPRRVTEALEVILETRDKRLAPEAMDLARDSWEPPDFVDRTEFERAVAVDGATATEPRDSVDDSTDAEGGDPERESGSTRRPTAEPPSKRESKRTSKGATVSSDSARRELERETRSARKPSSKRESQRASKRISKPTAGRTSRRTRRADNENGS